VIPKWLLNEFKLHKRSISYTPVELLGLRSLQLSVPNQETPRRAHHMGGLLLGSVCSDCNNHWMSALEDRVKPDLVRLIRDPAESPRDSVTLARWALKTAYTLSQFLNPPVGRVPRQHGLWPRDHDEGLPQGVAVFHRQMPDWKFWFSAPLTFRAECESKKRAQSRYRSTYRYIVQLGHALLMVQYWPDSTATLVYNGNICRLLLSSCAAIDEREPILEVPHPSPEFDLIMASKYELRERRRPGPTELCYCGSGLELGSCRARRHRGRLVDSPGWL
jgi:hypothetical protein